MKVFFIFIVFILIGCQKYKSKMVFTPPVFTDTTFLDAAVLNDSLLTLGSFDIDYCGDHLVMLADINKEMIHFFNKNTGAVVLDFISKGRGPEELLGYPNALFLNREKEELSFFDQNQKMIYFYSIDSLLCGKIAAVRSLSVLYDSSFYLTDAIELEHSVFGNINRYSPIMRFAKIKHGAIIDAYDYFPKPFGDDRDTTSFVKSYVFQQKGAVSEDRKKYVSGTNTGAILEIFDIEGDIRQTALKAFYEPIYEVNSYNLIVPNDETIIGFVDIYPTKEFIYTVFCGNRGDSFKTIALFDWDGNPVSMYQTDYNLMNICVDSDNGVIYAVGMNEALEFLLLKFDLKSGRLPKKKKKNNSIERPNNGFQEMELVQ